MNPFAPPIGIVEEAIAESSFADDDRADSRLVDRHVARPERKILVRADAAHRGQVLEGGFVVMHLPALAERTAISLHFHCLGGGGGGPNEGQDGTGEN
jgi:hypothetical protein